MCQLKIKEMLVIKPGFIEVDELKFVLTVT